MNSNRIKKLIQSKPPILVLGIMVMFMACSKNDEKCFIEKYPSLKIVNAVSDNNYISSVSLVGYDFNYLNIASGNSQTFTLENGMPGGYKSINVTISIRVFMTPIGSLSKTVNFNDGDTTIITLKGCRSYEGCKGIVLE
jgi:hypothetical protein